MKTLVLVFVVAQLLLMVWCHLRYVLFRKKYLSLADDTGAAPTIFERLKVYIVIPCLREKDIIVETIAYFLSIIPNRDIFKLIIVTTQKEDAEKRKAKVLIPDLVDDLKNGIKLHVLLEKYSALFSKKELISLIEKAQILSKSELMMYVDGKSKESGTTYDVVLDLIHKQELHNDVFLFDYPDHLGMMAHQLNYVLDQINIDGEQAYFCVYNADSRPHKRSFSDFLVCVHKNSYPKVVQQYSALISNLESLSSVMKGFAIYQSNFEIYNGYINALLPSKFLRNHLVGHGLFVEINLLRRIGGFTTEFWCEDIFLSFYLRNLKIYPVPLQSLEEAETPYSFVSLVKQNAVWFKTAFQAVKIFWRIGSTEKYTIEGWLFLFHQLRGSISWILTPTITLICLILPLIWCRFDFFAFVSFSYLLSQTVRYYETCSAIEIVGQKTIRNKLQLSLLASFSFLISNAGPMYSILSNKKEKYKTIR